MLPFPSRRHVQPSSRIVKEEFRVLSETPTTVSELTPDRIFSTLGEAIEDMKRRAAAETDPNRETVVYRVKFYNRGLPAVYNAVYSSRQLAPR